MTIRVNEEYLDFDDSIQVERQVKLFEDVSQINGDFSYSFDIPKTQRNISIIRTFSPDNSAKPWTSKIPATLESYGQIIYSGYIRVERETSRIYSCSFFSGNNNWFDLLNIPIRDSFTWKQYDTKLTTNNVRDSWTSTYRGAIHFPILDRGALSTRGSASWWLGDMQPFILVSKVFETITAQTGVKITGDLVKDPRFNALITSNNGRSGIEQRIEDRSIKMGKTTTQTASGTTFSKITLNNSSSPFYNSPNLNWSTTENRYIADADYREWTVTINLNMDRQSWYYVRILKNGTALETKKFSKTSLIQWTYNSTTLLSAGDYIEVQFAMLSGIFSSGVILTSSYIEIYPVKFYTVYADQLLPNLTASEFMSNIFRLFNCLVTYNPNTSEIKTRFFENILKQTPIDVSNYVQIDEDNYEDFVSDYSKRNFLIWQDQDNDDTTEYNAKNVIPFGGGLIEIDNDFLEDESTMIGLDFTAAFQQPYSYIGASMPNLKYVSVTELSSTEDNFSSVSDNGDGKARFNGIADVSADSLVRIKDSTVEEYNGDYRVESFNAVSNYVILQDVYFSSNATGTLVSLDWEEVNNEEQVLLLKSDQNLNFINFSGIDGAWFQYGTPLVNGNIGEVTFGYLFATKNLRGSLVFQDNIESDWGLTSRMLNSGVKSFGSAYLPAKVYNDIDLLSPLRYKSGNVNALFYPNRITGYEDSKTECTIELIKLL